MSAVELSQDYQEFYQHVFGDYRYYYYNGLPEKAINRLSGEERQKAEELILQAVNKRNSDERPIRAVGLFKLQEAIPMLKRLIEKNNKSGIRISAAWALFKIENDQQYSDVIIDVVNHPNWQDKFTRYNAIHLLSEFGREPPIIDTLLQVLEDPDSLARQCAISALIDLFHSEPAARVAL